MAENNFRWLILACVWLLIFSVYASVLSTSVVLGEVAEELRLSPSQAGIILSSPLVMLAVFALVGGFLGDVIGPKRTAGAGGLVLGASSLLRGFAGDFHAFLALSLSLGIGWGLIYPNLPKLIKMWFEEVGTPTGIYSTGIFVGGTMGLAATPSLVQPMIGGWRAAFYAWGLMALTASLIWWCLVKEPHRISGPRVREESRVIGIFRKKEIWILAVFFGLAGNMTFYVVSGWFPTFFMEKGLSTGAAAMLTSLVTVISIPFVFLIPLASDRSGRRKPYMWVSSIIAAAAFAGLVYGPEQLYWALMCLIGVALTATFIMGLIMPVELVGEGSGAAASGMVISVGYLIGAAGPSIAGYLREITGSLSSSILMLSAVLLLSAGLVALLPETGRKSG